MYRVHRYSAHVWELGRHVNLMQEDCWKSMLCRAMTWPFVMFVRIFGPISSRFCTKSQHNLRLLESCQITADTKDVRRSEVLACRKLGLFSLPGCW